MPIYLRTHGFSLLLTAPILLTIATGCSRKDPNMANAPAGCFQMGAPETEEQSRSSDRPVHQVCLDAFQIDKREVTVEDFQAVIASYSGPHMDCSRCPATAITWDEAKAYCESKNKRLPTEAEWEYAARAGSTTAFWWGDEFKADNAWYYWNSKEGPQPVATTIPNAWGLFDMAGNAWEWTADWSSPDYSGAQDKNPTGPSTGETRVIRGGAFESQEYLLHSAARAWLLPTDRNPAVGFRCVK